MAPAKDRWFTLIVPASRAGDFFHRVLMNVKKIIEHDGGDLQYVWTRKSEDSRYHKFRLFINASDRHFDWEDYLHRIARGLCMDYIARCNSEVGFPRAFLERLVPGFRWVSSMVPSARKGGGV